MWMARSVQPLAAALEAVMQYLPPTKKLYCPDCKSTTIYELDESRGFYSCIGHIEWHGDKMRRLKGCGHKKHTKELAQ